MLGERQASLLENIRMNTGRLLSLVSQLLDLGKLKTGKLQLDLDPTDVASLVQEAVDEIRPWAEDRASDLAIRCRTRSRSCCSTRSGSTKCW